MNFDVRECSTTFTKGEMIYAMMRPMNNGERAEMSSDVVTTNNSKMRPELYIRKKTRQRSARFTIIYILMYSFNFLMLAPSLE